MRVRVPQTSANLGAGFDTLGLALSVYNYFELEITQNGLEFFGCKDEFKNDKNLLYTSMKYLFEKYDFEANFGYRFKFETNIRECSGLGSSATCIVGGLLFGSQILEKNGIFVDQDDLIRIAIEIEGHGDNVVPAMLGSLTVVMEDEGRQFFRKIDVSETFKFATITSNIEKESTKKLRLALNQQVSLKDASFNIAHCVMTTIALEKGDKQLLALSIKDRVHEQYRKAFIENFDIIKDKALELGAISLNISGSGPSLIVIYDEKFMQKEFESFLATQKNDWKFTECNVDKGGAEIEEA